MAKYTCEIENGVITERVEIEGKVYESRAVRNGTGMKWETAGLADQVMESYDDDDLWDALDGVRNYDIMRCLPEE